MVAADTADEVEVEEHLKDLRPRHQTFVRRFVATGNATQAYIDSYKTDNRLTARCAASRLVGRKDIKRAIRAEQAIQEDVDAVGKRVERQLEAINNTNILDVCDIRDGKLSLKTGEEIDYNAFYAVESISQDAKGVKVKLYNKLQASDRLLRLREKIEEKSRDRSGLKKGRVPDLVIVAAPEGVHPEDVRIFRAPDTLVFVVHSKQGEWLSNCGQAQEILFGGAAGPGKSFFLRFFAVFAAFMIPNLRVGIFRRLWRDIMANHLRANRGFLEMLSPLIKLDLVKWNGSDKIFYFWNGSQIQLCALQREDDWGKYLGEEFHVLLWDEATQNAYAAMAKLRTRARKVGIVIPEEFFQYVPAFKLPFIAYATNPGGRSHSEFRIYFVKASPPNTAFRAPKDDGGMLRMFCGATLTDNPCLLRDDPEYADRLSGIGDPELVRAYRDGCWDITPGGMFGDVWEPTIHEIAPFKVPATWRISLSFDWGTRVPYACQAWAVADGCKVEFGSRRRYVPKKSAFLVGELYGWNGKPNTGLKETAPIIAQKILAFKESVERAQGRSVYWGPADPAIWADRDSGLDIASKLDNLGCFFDEGDSFPGSRAAGWEHMRMMMESAKNGDKDNPHLYVFNTCHDGFLRTVPTAQRDDGGDDIEGEDHSGDAARYAIYKILGGRVARSIKMTGWD